jgi:hypothetical protein
MKSSGKPDPDLLLMALHMGRRFFVGVLEMAKKRTALTKKIRFEVFKRDKFTCQYCGRMAPDVVLNVDHIHPVAKGGTDEIVNLVTSCHACNAGKKDRLIDDSDVIRLQSEQLKELAEKREQLQMMAEWRRELSNLEDDVARFLCECWASAFGYWPDESQDAIRKLARLANMQDAIECIETMAVKYSWKAEEECAQKLLAVYRYQQADKVNPGASRIAFIIGILKNKHLNPCHYKEIGSRLKYMMEHIDGFDIEEAVQEAKGAKTGFGFVQWLRYYNGGDGYEY